MEKFQKYISASGTISGTNYFLRNLLSTALAFICGMGLGIAMRDDNVALLLLFVVLLLPVLWFSICTIYKRINAFDNKNAGLYTVLLFSFQLVHQFIKGSDYEGVSAFGLLVVGAFLIFANSKIENHEG